MSQCYCSKIRTLTSDLLILKDIASGLREASDAFSGVKKASDGLRNLFSGGEDAPLYILNYGNFCTNINTCANKLPPKIAKASSQTSTEINRLTNMLENYKREDKNYHQDQKKDK